MDPDLRGEALVAILRFSIRAGGLKSHAAWCKGENKALIFQCYKRFADRGMEEAMKFLTPDLPVQMAGFLEPLDREGFKEFGMFFMLP